MCQNTERMLNMFSKELQILDHNTVTYMIDELQEQLNATQEQLDSTQEQLSDATAAIAKKDALLQKYIEKYGQI